MSDKPVTRRNFLYITTGTFTAAGAASLVWPFVDQMNPDASVKALASTEVDLRPIAPGQSITVLWRGKPVFIRRRTPEEISEAKAVSLDELPDPQDDAARAKNPEGEYNGWFCPCHGSHYDTSGRIRKGPAPTNLEIPDYVFLNDNTIKIG